jgi:acyl-CoA synthetase (NDP forming)
MKKTYELNRLLNPRKIAVIGATEKEGKIGNIIFQFLLHSRRRLFPVNPQEEVIFGHKAYNHIRSLPDNIDLAIITLSAEKAVTAAQEIAEKKTPYIIIVAGGFGEAGPEGKKLEERLGDIVKQYKCRILGPNSLGIFLPKEKIDTIFVEHGDRALANGGSVACILQSGSVGVEALGYASNTGFGMRAFIGLGNKIDLTEIDFLQYFKDDADTNCIAFYLENIERGKLFLEEAGKVTPEKPIIILKAGRTSAGSVAVSSHTGKLSGRDDVISGALKQYGIQRVFDDEELCDAAKTLSSLPLPSSNRVAVLTPAGGYGVMCTDYIEKSEPRAALKMAQLKEETKMRIKESTFPFASCNNPVDITASATNRMIGDSMDALLDDENVDIIICIAFFAPQGITDELIDIISERVRGSAKPIIVFSQYGPFTDRILKNFYNAGVTGFPSVYRAVRSARYLVERKDILNKIKNNVPIAS